MSLDTIPSCTVAVTLENIASEQYARGKQEPSLELVYFQAGHAIRRALHQHVKGCAECRAEVGQ